MTTKSKNLWKEEIKPVNGETSFSTGWAVHPKAGWDTQQQEYQEASDINKFGFR